MGGMSDEERGLADPDLLRWVDRTPAEIARIHEYLSTCVMCRVEEGRREPATTEVTHPREGGGYPACEMHAARLGWER